MCDYCGAQWYRSRLVRDGAGLLRCPDEGDGMDMVTASREDAEAVRGRRDKTGAGEPGNIKGTVDI